MLARRITPLIGHVMRDFERRDRPTAAVLPLSGVCDAAASGAAPLTFFRRKEVVYFSSLLRIATILGSANESEFAVRLPAFEHDSPV